MKILIAEDDPAFCEILKKMIAAHGDHQLTVATNGDEAWSYLDDHKRHFDVVFLDIHMPETDGLQVLNHIRESPLLRSLQVIMCTASSDRETVSKAIQLGTRHYLVKPCTEAAVVAKLKQIEAILAEAGRSVPSVLRR